MAAVLKGVTCLYGVAGTVTNLYVQSYTLTKAYELNDTTQDETGKTVTARYDGITRDLTVDGIAKTGKPVTGFGIEGHGDIDIIAKASRVAKDYLQWATELPRVECSLDELWVSAKCGESDTTRDAAAGRPVRDPRGPDTSHDPQEPGQAKRVLRGGSYLCTDQYCSRYIVGTLKLASARSKTTPITEPDFA